MSKSQQEIAAPRADYSANEPHIIKSFFSTKRMTRLAALVAIAVVLKMLGNAFSLSNTVRVTFVYLPWLLGGVIAGPIGGCIIGLVSDIVSAFLVPVSAFSPITMLSNTLFPLGIALVYKLVPLKNDYIKCAIGTLIALVVCTMGIGAFGAYVNTFGYDPKGWSIGFFEFLYLYRIPQAIICAINGGLLLLLIRPLQKLGIFPQPQAAAWLSDRWLYVIFQSALCALLAVALTMGAPEADAERSVLDAYSLTCIVACSTFLILSLLNMLLLTSKLAQRVFLLATALLISIEMTVTALIVRQSAAEVLFTIILPALAVSISGTWIATRFIKNKKLKDILIVTACIAAIVLLSVGAIVYMVRK